MNFNNLAIEQLDLLVRKVGGMPVVEGIISGELIYTGTARLAEPGNAVFRVRVDYSKSLQEMIETGNFNREYTNLSNVSVNGSGECEVNLELVHFDRPLTTSDVLAELDRRGYRGAKVEELLTFAATFPDIQQSCFILALGSIWTVPGIHTETTRYAAMLYANRAGRCLASIRLDEGVWAVGNRFLAVRK